MEGKVLNYKLAWVDASNSSVLYSKMFDTKEEALKESEGKKDFMVFFLKKMDNGNYTWELLPYGNYNSYKSGIWITDFWSAYKGWIFVGLGALLAYKIAFSQDKKS